MGEDPMIAALLGLAAVVCGAVCLATTMSAKERPTYGAVDDEESPR